MKNLLIKSLAMSINDDTDGKLGITVSANGSVITGKIISSDAYFEHVNNQTLKEIIDFLESLPSEKDEEVKLEEEGSDKELTFEMFKERVENFKYLHLIDARYIFGTSLIPTKGTAIRIAIDSIDSISMGYMSTDTPN